MIDLKKMLADFIDEQTDKVGAIGEVRQLLHDLHPNNDMPVDLVEWVPIEKVQPNDYNPNTVAEVELALLLQSIEHDGYTQPVVTVYDAEQDKYIIVDGFHRYFVMKRNKALQEKCHGLLPCVVIKKGINDRMASTVRHNRARGKHTVNGMANLVFQMLDNGMDDKDVCNELGMEPEELLRLKHITGFSKLFADVEYNRAWVTRRQILIKQKYARDNTVEKE